MRRCFNAQGGRKRLLICAAQISFVVRSSIADKTQGLKPVCSASDAG